jgi:hypothetical protein
MFERKSYKPESADKSIPDWHSNKIWSRVSE